MSPRTLALLAIGLLAAGCSRIGYSPRATPADAAVDVTPADGPSTDADSLIDDGAPPPTDGGPGLLTVEPTYPNAQGFLQHVRRTAPSLPHYAQPGAACEPDVDKQIGACVHAGIQRKAETSLPSCDGLEGRDTLDALQWTCDDSGGQAVFYATGLRDTAGLGALVEVDRFKTIALEVLEQGQLVAASAPGIWWSNPVRPLPASNQTTAVALTEAGVIYTVAQDTDSAGHNIEADRVAVVVLRGAKLTMTDGPSNAALNTGERAGADHRCLLAAGGQRFLWIEGTLRNGANGVFGVHVMYSSYVTFRQLRVGSFNQIGISLQRSDTCRLHDVVASNNGHYGIVVAQASNHVLRDVTVAGNGTKDGPGYIGLFVQYASDNVITRLTAAHNRPYGVALMTGASSNTIGYATLAANTFAGLQAAGDGGHTVFHVVAVKNGQHGVRLNAPGSQLAQSAAGHQARGFSGEAGTVLSGTVVVADNTNHCQFDGAAVPCASMGTVTVREKNGLLDAFWGRIESDDTINASDDRGQAARNDISDWVGFENRHRAWGGEEPAVPLGVCEVDCRIWDWRLVYGEAKLDLGGGAGPLTEGQPCPAGISGDAVLTDKSGNTFLVDALELLGDGLGDEDGLCESNEGCAYMPHIGDDQLGWVPGAERCVFSDGAVSGVQIVGWVYGGA